MSIFWFTPEGQQAGLLGRTLSLVKGFEMFDEVVGEDLGKGFGVGLEDLF